MAEPDRRETKRFHLQQPALVTYANGGTHEISVVTLNASIGGALVLSGVYLREGSQVALTVFLKNQGSATSVRLYAVGTLVRVEKRPEEKYSLGIVFDQPAKLMR